MNYRVAEALARVTGNFAILCYQHGYGCAQSLVSYKVLPVIDTDYSELSPYVEECQARANAFVEDFVKAMVGR